MHKHCTKLLAGVVAVGVVGAADAALLLEYTGDLDPSTEAGLQGSTIAAGPGLTSLTSNGTNVTGNGFATPDEPSAIAADDYFEIVVTADAPGYVLDDITVSTGGSGANRADAFSIFVDDDAAFGSPTDLGNFLTGGTDVAALGGLNLASGESLTVRIFGYDPRGATADLRLFTVAVNGEPIPEPTALSIAGLGAIPLLRRRTRRS